MNDENLKHGNPATQFRSGREAVENGNKGGIASGVARRKKRDLRLQTQYFFSLMNKDEDMMQTMIDAGISDEEMTNSMVMIVSMFQRVKEGSVGAAEFLCDKAGYSERAEEHKDVMRQRKKEHKDEIEQRKAELDYKKEKDTKMEKGINRSTEDDPITKALKGEFNIAD